MVSKKIIYKYKDFIVEFFKRKLGVIGLGLIVFFVILSILAPIIAPLGLNEWAVISKWQDNPRAVPPEWFVQITNQPYLPTLYFETTEFQVETKNIGKHILVTLTSTIEFDYTYTAFPNGLVFYANIIYTERIPFANIILERPDGEKIIIDYTSSGTDAPKPLENTVTVYNARFTDKNDKVKESFYKWLKEKSEYSKLLEERGIRDKANLVTNYLFFAKLNENILLKSKAEILQGRYKIILSISQLMSNTNTEVEFEEKIKIEKFSFVIQGNSYGVMGTDGDRRDVWVGLLWGSPIALMIGVLTSLIAVMVGITYGTVSGYFGGKLDEVMMRIVDVMLALPVFPILILLMVMLGPSRTIFIIILLIAAFGWMTTARVARSMTLQLKETVFIEAIRALGASTSRIMFRHIMPQMLPYAYANLALGVPAAILTEAGLSFLGLGDPTIPTWGQILRHAQLISAVQFGYWWLWIPPGLLIAGMSVAFVFVGHAIDEILNPKIKKL